MSVGLLVWDYNPAHCKQTALWKKLEATELFEFQKYVNTLKSVVLTHCVHVSELF